MWYHPRYWKIFVRYIVLDPANFEKFFLYDLTLQKVQDLERTQMQEDVKHSKVFVHGIIQDL